MNLTTLISQFKKLTVGFPYTSYADDVLVWFNEAQQEIAKKKIIEHVYTTTSTASQSTLDLPDTLIDIIKDAVFVDGKRILSANFSSIIKLYGDEWKGLDAGTPTHYIRNGEEMIFVPAIEDAGKSIEIHHWAYPNDLSSGTDVPFTTGNAVDGYNYHNHLRGLDSLVRLYAVSLAKFAIGKYGTRVEALSEFYNLLNANENNIDNQEHLSQPPQFSVDGYRLRVLATRRGMS